MTFVTCCKVENQCKIAGLLGDPSLNCILMKSTPILISGAFELTSVHLRFSFVLGTLAKPDGPGDNFQNEADGTQHAQNDDVDGGPLVSGPEDVKTLEDVDDDDHNGGVAHGVVIHVPVLPEFGIWLGPQDQSKNLESGQCENAHAKVAMFGRNKAAVVKGVQPQTHRPCHHAQDVPRALARHVDVEPGWVGS